MPTRSHHLATPNGEALELPGLLTLLLPPAGVADLVTAATADGAAATEAWARWSSLDRRPQVERLAADRTVARPLLPLLYESIRQNGIPLDGEVATYLRSACLRETLRGRIYRDVVAETAAALHRAGIEFLVIKGAAIGRTYYRDASLRHAHDLEIVVRDASAVRPALEQARFRPVRHQWEHPTGLPLRVHGRLFGDSSTCDEGTAWTSAASTPEGWSTPDAAWTLAHVLVHASRSRARASCRWVPDAHAIVRSGAVDWVQVVRIIEAAGAALPAALQLEWLRRTLGTGVPDACLERLARAGLPRGDALDAVVRGLHAGRIRWFVDAWRSAGWSLRRRLAATFIRTR